MRGLRFSRATLAKVVAFTVVSTVFTVGLAMKIGNLRPFSHSYGMQAVFADASGVFKGDAVKLAGVDVGRVSGTKIEDGRAVVSFSVDKDVVLPRDTVVAIRWRNVLGQRFLYLYPGHAKGRRLQNGDRVPLAQTEDAGDLGAFLNHLGPILKAIDPRKANAFIDAVNTALVGNEAQVRQLLDDGGTLAQALADMDSQIKSLIGSSDTIMATYASQNQAIKQILDDLDQLGGQLGGMTGDIDSLITNFADVEQQLHELLSKNKGNIDVSLSELDSVAGTLARNRGNLAETLCTLPAGVAGYFQTTSWGEWFNVRVIGVTLKDSNDTQVAQVNEAPIEHGPAVAPYTCGVPLPSGGSKGQGAKGSSGATNPETLQETSQAFDSLSAFVDFVLGGKHG